MRYWKVIVWMIFLSTKNSIHGCGRSVGIATPLFLEKEDCTAISDDRAFDLVQSKLATKSDLEEKNVLKLLRAGRINPRVQDEGAVTLTHLAACYGACAVADYLINKVKVPLTRDVKGKNPLHWAVSYPSNEAMILFLLTASKDLVKERDGEGNEPFSYVVSYDEYGDILLQNGACVDGLDRMGRSSLFYYTSAANTDFLCAHGADVNRIDNNGLPVLSAYLAYYFDVKRRNMVFADSIKDGIRSLLRYGAVVPTCYHPMRNEPCLPEGAFYECSKAREEVLQAVFESILKKAHEDLAILHWGYQKAQSENARKRLNIRAYELTKGMIPFFKARCKEVGSFLQGDTNCSCGQPYNIGDEVVGLLAFCSSAPLPPQVNKVIKLVSEWSSLEGRIAPTQKEKMVLGRLCLDRLFLS